MFEQAVIRSEWTDKDWNKMSKWLHSVLQTTVVTVTFTKKDGTERVMNCTLNPEILPPTTVTEGKTERKKSDTTMSVYDTDAKGWRSFTIKSLKHISLTI